MQLLLGSKLLKRSNESWLTILRNAQHLDHCCCAALRVQVAPSTWSSYQMVHCWSVMMALAHCTAYSSAPAVEDRLHPVGPAGRWLADLGQADLAAMWHMVATPATASISQHQRSWLNILCRSIALLLLLLLCNRATLSSCESCVGGVSSSGGMVWPMLCPCDSGTKPSSLAAEINPTVFGQCVCAVYRCV